MPADPDPARNTETLRSAIDSGRTGDKVPITVGDKQSIGDPATAPLGTDAETSGVPVTPRMRVQAARQVLSRAVKGIAARPPGAHEEAVRVVGAMFAVLAGAIIVAAFLTLAG